ncbi:MAG: beta-propeller domain-containing protein [Thiothrix sp.]
MKNLQQLGLSLSIALLLTACGGGGTSTTVNNTSSNSGTASGTTGSTTGSNSDTASGTTGSTNTANKPALKQAASNPELESQFKQQLLDDYGTTRELYPVYAPAVGSATATSTDSAAAASGAASSFSSTNIQEAGVDEADRVKTDGTYLYTLSTTTYDYPVGIAVPLATTGAATTTDAAVSTSLPAPMPQPPTLRIFKTNQASSTLAKEMPLDSDSSIIPNGLYLNGQKLVALAEKGQMFGIWDNWFAPTYWMNQQSQVYLLDVSTPENPTQTAKLTIDGQVISSRKIGSTLYLATRHSPSLPGLYTYPTTDAEAAANRNLINNANLADFLPDYQLNNNAKAEIFAANDCFTTQYSGKTSYQSSVISLLAIDLNNSTPTPHGKCFVGDTETLYASLDAIYLATTQYNYTTTASSSDGASTTIAVYDPAITTDLHKFSLENGGIDYRGSGRVSGHLGWQQDLKPFRMSEYNGVLRLITYTGSWNDRTASPASLYTLQENSASQSLDILAKLPNSTRPAPLGKIGEQIYATRFLGDKGYLVTFRTTDPLYILDLSNPADPFIASELKIDGYSDYLHPVGTNYLLGVGKDAVIDTSGSFGDEGRGAWYQGVKLSLIDITSPSAPYEKQKIIIGKRGTETAVSQTHHALTTLQNGDNLQMALPVSLHEGTPSYSSGSSTYYNWTQDELYRLNIDTRNGVMQTLTPIVSEVAASNDPYGYYSNYLWPYDRSVMIGNNIHYLHGDKVISQAW